MLQKKTSIDSARADGINRKGEKVRQMTEDELRSLIERECGPVQRVSDMLWAVEVASVAMAAERERCAKYLRDAAERLAPEGKRINQIDRHTAHVLACKGDELAAGYAWRDVGEGEQK